MGKSNFFLYKKRPLVRKDNVIYYGYMYENVVAMLTIKSTHKVKNLDIGDDIQIQLISTDPQASPQDVVIKHSEKKNLFDALDIAEVWIDRYTKKVNS